MVSIKNSIYGKIWFTLTYQILNNVFIIIRQSWILIVSDDNYYKKLDANRKHLEAEEYIRKKSEISHGKFGMKQGLGSY